MKKITILILLPICSIILFSDCEKEPLDTFDQSSQIEQFLEESSTKSSNIKGTTDLQFLSKFETLYSLGFSPDGITYSPKKNHLFISSAGAETYNKTGIFEVTLTGELVNHIRFEDTPAADGGLGYSITRASSGPKVGHFFLSGVLEEATRIQEFDKNWNWVHEFTFTSPSLNAHPGDGAAFNHISKNIVVAEEVHGDLFEITTDGEFVRSLSNIYVQGITFNRPTGSYFGVTTANLLREISTDGNILREFDLSPYGVEQPVGIASGQGKLFIADEIDVPNSGGYIYIFKSPTKVH